ncbi:MAG TPA: ABC transporter ATP-binding protein [Lachnospiraceae bacterium]|nr:ABC transporter ATP-binding protein [Lachnospiraceae bacterium]
MGGPLIQCQDVWKRYGKKEALRGLNLTLESGKIVGLLGPNGSGKTTLIKVLNGLLCPEHGTVLIDGEAPGTYTKSIISYLPDKPYFAGWMKVSDLFDFFGDFYMDFDRERAEQMCKALLIDTSLKMKTLSKGTKEKVQLILVMSRRAKLYLLDEPIAGVDPAARDFILSTILNNYNQDGTVLISTHLISDVERVLDEVVFIQNGQVVRQELVDDIREKEGKSVDELFREVFRTIPYGGGEW